ncbi:MAG: hypothetical protein ACE5KH_04420 [Candidatus Geothermarchaeales archaeon]
MQPNTFGGDEVKYEASETGSLPWGFLSGFLGLVVGLSLGIGVGWAAWFTLGEGGPEYLRPAIIPAVIVGTGWILLLALGLTRKPPEKRVWFGLASVLGFAIGVGLGLGLALLVWAFV